MHDSPDELQKPLHSGALASPHAVVRHSHAPPEVTAEQCPPFAHVPSHRWSLELKSHGPVGIVVVVVETTVSGPRAAAAQRYVPRLKVRTRFPPRSSVICAAGGNGFGQNTR